MAPRPTSRLRWQGEDEFALDGLRFELRAGAKPAFESTPERFCLRKARWAVEALEELISELRPSRIVEVGVKQGGSAALLSQLAAPEKLIGIELNPEPVPALEKLASSRTPQDALSIHYGVDQADAGTLERIVEREVGSKPLDLVVDDASHMVDPSRTTFETLFPRLRPGGLYLLEDWSWAHAPIPIWPGRQPLSALVFELTVVCGSHPEIIDELRINRGWAVARRGPAPLEPVSFRLGKLYGKRGRELLPGPDAGKDRPDRRRRFGPRRWLRARPGRLLRGLSR